MHASESAIEMTPVQDASSNLGQKRGHRMVNGESEDDDNAWQPKRVKFDSKPAEESKKDPSSNIINTPSGEND